MLQCICLTEGQRCGQSQQTLEATSHGRVTARIKGSFSASFSDFTLHTGPSLEERREPGTETKECKKRGRGKKTL